MQTKSTFQDMSKFIQTKCHLLVVTVHIQAKLKEIYTSIWKTIMMKIQNLYNYQISNIYFHSSGSNLGLNLLVVAHAIKYLIEKTMLPDIFKFIHTKSNILAVIVHMHAMLENIYTSISKTITMNLLNLYNILNKKYTNQLFVYKKKNDISFSCIHDTMGVHAS